MSDIDTAETGAPVVPEAIESDKAEAVKTDEQQEGDESQESTTEESEQKPRKRDNVQKRINELTAEKWAEKREKEQLLRELEAVRSQYRAPSQAPRLEDFNYDTEAYQEAVYNHAREESLRQSQAQYEQQRQQQKQYEANRYYEDLLENHAQREKAYIKANPDYAEQVDYMIRSIQFSRELGEVIGESERSPEILHHLATHIDEAAKVAEMPPHRAAAYIARLDAQLASKPKPVSKAPAPAPALHGSAVNRKDPNNPEISIEEFMRLRNAKS